jgi:hypothetical protein
MPAGAIVAGYQRILMNRTSCRTERRRCRLGVLEQAEPGDGRALGAAEVPTDAGSPGVVAEHGARGDPEQCRVPDLAR